MWSTSGVINSVNDKISNSKEEKNSITMSIARLDGGITESYGEHRWQHLHLHLHLQLRSGQLHNGKRVGAHGSLHHLRNGGKNSRKSTPIDTAHTAQYSLVGASISKVQRQGRVPRWHCKRWFWFVCSIHWAGIICVTNKSRKSHVHYFTASRMFSTSSWCSIRLYSGQNGRCTNVIINSKVRMSRYLDTSTEAQKAKSMVQYGRSSRSSRKESVRSSFGRTGMGKTTWQSSTGTRLWESFQLGYLFRTPWKKIILICLWMTSNWLERNIISIRCGKY